MTQVGEWVKGYFLYLGFLFLMKFDILFREVRFFVGEVVLGSL